jgi:outer membrane protein insertion porin family
MLLCAPVARSQGAPLMAERTATRTPATVVIQNIRVEGTDDPRTREFVLQTSGLATGQEIELPGGTAIANAIRSIYDLRLFSDVKIYEEARSGNDVTLVIEVTPEPTLGSYRFEGIKGRHEDDLREQAPLLRGRPVRPADLERTKQVIKDFYAEKGYLRTEVNVEEATTGDRVNLVFDVDRNKKVEVEEIDFVGNAAFDDGDLRGAMEETRENRWWRFWKGEKFKEDAYEDDLQKIIDFYNEQGYYDAQLVSDSVYFRDNDGIGIQVRVQEGNRYYVRNLDWEGNTVFPDRALNARLGLEENEPYNGKRLEENLFGNRRGSDILGLYMDRGYMRANVQPQVRVVGDDSLDITFDVREGEVYNFGDIRISGNTKTKEHVIRRELYTVPGQRFSRSAIQESIRRLMQLNYFSQESLAAGPDVSVDERNKQADLVYNVEEVGSDQLELSGTWSQFGLVLQLGFQFNNFSAQNLFNTEAWRPLPSGDGQQLGVNVRTNGSFFQNYRLSFTEPWFRGNPTPIGGSVSYSKYTRSLFASDNNNGTFQNISTSFFFQQRLNWPDDKFTTGTRLSYQYYNNEERLFNSVPEGVSHSVSVRQSLTRNSLDNPMFPRSGSNVNLSVEVAPPVGALVQYHKWRFTTNWNVPFGEKLSFGVGTNFGYIGSLSGDPVEFERFEVGGTPFDYSGFRFGTEPIFMRGYPQQVIGPRERVGGTLTPVGGRILNKYTSEVRWMAVESQQLRAQPYAFLDAANAWSGFDTYNPSQLFRSGGVGVKLFLPIVGMIEFNYGYNFDRYTPIENGDSGARDWSFQFSLGQGIGN